MGNEIKYSFPDEENRTDDDALLETFDKTDISQVDTELSRDISGLWVGMKYVYQNYDGVTKYKFRS